MSDQNPYEKLGVSEDASFDEIHDVRNRLLEQYSGDSQRLEGIEASYDAILMERLRMRQEGKIKVPERIRFPERLAQPLPKENLTSANNSPAWLQTMLDKPSVADVLLPGVIFSGLSGLSIFYSPTAQLLQLVLVVGVGISIYFINRKEGKFGRAVLLTMVSLIAGLIVGGLLGGLVVPQIKFMLLTIEQFSTVLGLLLLWLVSSFLK